MRSQLQYPIVELRTKVRSNQYSTIDPWFHIAGWTDASGFDAITGPAPVAIAAPEKVEPDVKRTSAEIIDDSIPF